MLILHDPTRALPVYAYGLTRSPYVRISGQWDEAVLCPPPPTALGPVEPARANRFAVVNNLTRFMEAVTIEAFLQQIHHRLIRPACWPRVEGLEVSPDEFRILKIAYLLMVEFRHDRRSTTGKRKVYLVSQNFPPETVAEYRRTLAKPEPEPSDWLFLAKIIQAIDDFQHLLDQPVNPELVTYLTHLSGTPCSAALVGVLQTSKKKRGGDSILQCSTDAVDESGTPYLIVDRLTQVDILDAVLQSVVLETKFAYVMALRDGTLTKCESLPSLLEDILAMKLQGPTQNQLDDNSFVEMCLTRVPIQAI